MSKYHWFLFCGHVRNNSEYDLGLEARFNQTGQDLAKEKRNL